jgi:CsoR family transcriptional regulator, copper-sensing transcriptional repressor
VTTPLFSEKDKAKITARLSRLEGQMRGLRRMIDEDRDCTEIVQQLNAARAALERAGSEIVVSGLRGCLSASKLDRATSSRFDETLTALAALRA